MFISWGRGLVLERQEGAKEGAKEWIGDDGGQREGWGEERDGRRGRGAGL